MQSPFFTTDIEIEYLTTKGQKVCLYNSEIIHLHAYNLITSRFSPNKRSCLFHAMVLAQDRKIKDKLKMSPCIRLSHQKHTTPLSSQTETENTARTRYRSFVFERPVNHKGHIRAIARTKERVRQHTSPSTATRMHLPSCQRFIVSRFASLVPRETRCIIYIYICKLYITLLSTSPHSDKCAAIVNQAKPMSPALTSTVGGDFCIKPSISDNTLYNIYIYTILQQCISHIYSGWSFLYRAWMTLHYM